VKGQLRDVLRNGLPINSWAAYGFALICFLVATIVRLSLNPISPDIQSFATYYPAVLFAALVGGAGPGLLAMTLSAAMGWWAFSPPYFAMTLPTPGEEMDFVLFISAASVIVWGAVGYRKVLWKLNEEERFREATVNELVHRVKNNLTTVHAIIRHELRSHPDIWHNISGRLRSLAATDEFVRNSANETASLCDILVMESAPYAAVRFHISGPDVRLSRKLAITLALMFHELATNAAKYGALSSPEGFIDISWKLSGKRVDLKWIEREGPEVSAPTRRGFGVPLLERGLAPYDGVVELSFRPGGLLCTLAFSASEREALHKLGVPSADGIGELSIDPPSLRTFAASRPLPIRKVNSQ
jgi:two-component sensor histidine kinase